MSGALTREARDYRQAGVNILPIAPGTKRPPAGLRWAPWQHRAQSAAEVERLVEENPGADVAVVLGQVSGGLLDIESDGREGEDALKFLRLPLLPTAMFESPRGVHRLYRSPHPLRSHISLGPKLDILAAGRYVVAPTSKGRSWISVERIADATLLPEPWVDVLGRAPAVPTIARESTPEVGEASNQICLDTCVPSRSLIARGGLEEYFMHGDVVRLITATLGIHAEIGRSFHCVLPGHKEINPSASLCRNGRGTIVYRDWHARGGIEWITLPEVRAALAYGEVRRLHAPELATWGLRLLVEGGVLQPIRVPTVELPADARRAVHKVYEGFLLLLACKWLHGPGAPTTFSWRFASAWCGVSERHAGEAIRKLIHWRVIHQVGDHRGVALFLPAT